jgi:chemotaxis protein CheC
MTDIIQQSISEPQRSLLQNIFAHGAKQAESVLQGMVSQPMQVVVDAVQVFDALSLRQQVAEHYDDNLSWVYMQFTGGVSGSVAMLFPQDSTAVLINTLTQSTMNNYEMDVCRMGMITEVGNILMNGVISKLCDTKQGEVSFGLPDYVELSAMDFPAMGQKGSVVITANVNFCVSELSLPSLFMLQIEQEGLASFSQVLEEAGATV